MREKMYHFYLKKLFYKFDRMWFPTYSYLNVMDGCYNQIDVNYRDSDYEAKKMLDMFVKRKLIARKDYNELKLNNKGRIYSININEELRLTGKAIIELHDVFDIKIEDSDYSEAAILTLSE